MNTKHAAVLLYTLPLFLTGMVTRLIGVEHIGQTIMATAFLTLIVCGIHATATTTKHDLKELLK